MKKGGRLHRGCDQPEPFDCEDGILAEKRRAHAVGEESGHWQKGKKTRLRFNSQPRRSQEKDVPDVPHIVGVPVPAPAGNTVTSNDFVAGNDFISGSTMTGGDIVSGSDLVSGDTVQDMVQLRPSRTCFSMSLDAFVQNVDDGAVVNGADLSSDTSDVTGTESVAGDAFGVADVVPPDSLETGAVDTDGGVFDGDSTADLAVGGDTIADSDVLPTEIEK
eukprot:Skav201961  [mRNA]  locus=scaffold103:221422:223571:+ [translate_table: standard]